MNWQPLQRPLQLRSMADARRLCHLLRGVATPLQIKLAVDAANENAARGQFSPIEFVMARPKQRLSGSFETHQRMLCGRR